MFCKSKRGRALQAQASAGIDETADDEVHFRAVEEGAKQLEDAFAQAMTGKSKHRLKDAKVILRITEPAVIQFLATWRKKAHFLPCQCACATVVPDSGVARAQGRDVGCLG